MDALQRNTGAGGCRRFSHALAALSLAWSGGTFAQDVVSVPAAHLHHAEGSVAYAPQGDKEWHDVQPRRLLKRGDRLWTDRGSRAEVQAGGHALRLNGETQLVLENVGDTATQLSLTQGAIVATVTHLNPGDSFEIGTPNLAFRARQPGDYRVDVDTKQGVTRIVVLAGSAVVYGEKGEALEVKNGQRVTFRERALSRVQQPAFAANDDFDKWAGARRRGEPTVSMPNVAQATAPASPSPGFINKGKDIVITGPASSLPGARTAAATAAAVPAQAVPKLMPAAAAPIATAAPQVKAQALPNVPLLPTSPAAVPLRVTAAGAGTAVASSVPSASVKAEAEARARAQIEAAAQAAREQQERERIAQQRADEEHRAAQARAEGERRAAAAAEAKRVDSERRAAEAKRAESERRTADAKRAESERRTAEAKRAESERRAEARRAENERHVAEAKRTESERRAVAMADTKRSEERRHSHAAKRAEEDRRSAQARREQEARQEAKRVAAARRAEEERRAAQAKRAAEEQRLAAARKVEAQKIAEARKQQLARLQDQARREEQSAQARRDQARRADEERREEQARREESARREEQARHDEDLRRQRATADQARRDQERRDQEVWLRQQQVYPPQPARPAPMGVPARRVS